MKILVVGKGGREHALAKAAHASKLCDQLYCAPGNPGMAKIATCLNVSDSDIEGLVKAATDNEIDLTIVGPEATLSLGIVDAFEKEGLKIFGPTKAATQVESSKDFAKQIMAKYDIPTAAYQTFDNYEEAWKYVESKGAPIVIKEDGLKAGKGVTVAMDLDQANEALKIAFDIENNQVVIEEYLEGFEFSLICLVHNELVVPLEVAQDHKCVFDGDKGPNTGGKSLQSFNRLVKAAVSAEFKKRVGLLIDVNGYKEDRYEKICKMAVRVAKDVRRTKVDATLDPMPADERKAIHNALAKMADISTKSEGEGEGRRLRILYTPGKEIE